MRHDNVPPHSSPIRPKYAHRHKPMPDAPTGQKGRVRNQVLPMLRSGQNARSCRSADLVPKLRRAVPTS